MLTGLNVPLFTFMGACSLVQGWLTRAFPRWTDNLIH